MDNLFCLIKVQLLSYFGINKLAHKKTKNGKAKIVGVGFILAGIGAFIFFISFVYSSMFADIFYQANLLTYYIPLIFTIVSFLTFIFSIGNVNGVMFGFKDYNMLMSLPIKTRTIIVSKLIYTYISNMFFTFMIMIPALINYGLYTTNSFSFYLFYIIGMFFTPLIPIAASMIIGTLFSFITSRLKYKNQINTIVLFVFFILIFVSSFFMGYMGEEAITSLSNISSFYTVAALFNHATTNFWQLLLFITISLVVFAIPAIIISIFFVKINTLLISRGTSKKYKIKAVKNKTPMSSLLIREIKRIFAVPVYALNCLLGIVMLIGLTILLSAKISSIVQVDGIKEIVVGLLPFAVGFIVMLSPTTNCGISIEGKTFWVIKSSPIPDEKILTSKLLLDYVFYLPITLICTIILGIFMKLELISFILFVLICLLFVVFSGALGLLINLRFPMMNWENETAPVKRGVSTLFTMLIGLGVCILLGVASFFLIKVSLIISLLLVFATMLILSVIIMYLLYTKGVKLYKNI